MIFRLHHILNEIMFQLGSPMNINYVIALTGLATSSIAALAGWRFYVRFGRGTGNWSWLLMTTGSVTLTISEFFDAVTTFQGGSFVELSDFFAILTEILLATGFVRLFNRELVEEKIRQQKLEANLAKSEGLLSAAMQMTASLNLEETLQTLLQRAAALTDADIATIYLTERSGKLAGKYFGILNNSDWSEEGEHGLGTLTQQILTTGRPVLVENLREQPKYVLTPVPGKLTALGGFPLQEKGEILGILFVGFKQAHSFSEDQQLLLISIADHGALALRNAALYKQVEELSLTDPLTGLANRRQFDQTLEVELARAHRYADSLSLVILDIDHFKRINDTWGHPAGDASLRQIAGILCEHIRLTDLAARVGGEEMALILPHTEPCQAEQLAERLREQIQQTPLLWNGNAIQMACSFGVCGGASETLPERPSELYSQADMALYCAKQNGRNRVISR